MPRPGRLALFLEGGYRAAALTSSVEATLGALLGDRASGPLPTKGGPGMAQLRADDMARRRAIDTTRAAAGP